MNSVCIDNITYVRENTGVLQPWLADIGLKLQSILLSGLRATDTPAPNVKKCVRWLRGVALKNGDPEKQDYMQKIDMSEELIWNAMEELQYLPVHFVHHFADSFAVVAYHHPDNLVRDYAAVIHGLIAVELFHFKPETKEEFLARHVDRRGPKQSKASIVATAKSFFTGLTRREIKPESRCY